MLQQSAAIEHRLMPEDQLFFIHIPKTAGTTLIQIVEREFEEREIARWRYPVHLVNAPDNLFSQHRYLHGHLENKVLSRFLARPPVKMTMVREPVSRYLSHFANHTRVTFAQIPDITLEVFNELQETSLRSFVEEPPEILKPLASYFQNIQAKMIAAEFASDPDQLRQEVGRLLETGYYLPEPSLEQAQHELDTFAFVGLTERFQDSLFLLAYTFGWQPVVEYTSRNIAPQPSTPSDLPPDLRDQIAALNQLDTQLYAYAERLFEQRFQQMERELLERYGGPQHTQLTHPLPQDVLVELLDTHYRQCFAQRQPAVSSISLSMTQKVTGQGWGMLERDPNHGPFRWSGPGRRATIDLPIIDSQPVWLRFSVAMAITPATLESLKVLVNDEPVALARRRSKVKATIYEGYLPQELLARSPGCARVTFEVEKTFRPCDIIPSSKDDRPLGIALSWLKLEPARPLVEEYLRLKMRFEELEEGMAALQRQVEAFNAKPNHNTADQQAAG